MSEHLRRTPEQQEDATRETIELHETIKNKIEDGKVARNEHAENIDTIRKNTETIARSSVEVLHGHEHDNLNIESEATLHINKELEAMAYKRTLTKTRSQLSTPSKAFSKFIHQPTIESISDLAGETIARPSGVLVGGFVAFLGSSLFLWVSRYYGYEYNFLLFALFFIGGFFMGLVLELCYRLVRRK